MTDEEREAIWRTTDMNDTDMQVEMLKSLQGSAVDMKIPDRAFFLNQIEHIIRTDVASVTDRHIDLVKEICSTGRHLEGHDEIA